GCLRCGVEFRHYKSSGGRRRFCSLSCLSANAREGQSCKTCGGPIMVPRSHHRKFCSKKCHAIGQRLEAGRALRNEAVASYKRHANERGLPWQLSDAEVDKLFAGNCYWCGDPPANRRYRERSHGDFVYNGIDRLNNAKPYHALNCVSCCFTCNSMK